MSRLRNGLCLLWNIRLVDMIGEGLKLMSNTLIETGWLLTKWVTLPLIGIYIICKILLRVGDR
jgi:hypothetical protein